MIIFSGDKSTIAFSSKHTDTRFPHRSSSIVHHNMPVPITEGDINVRYKQQRLLLLRHASKCKHDPGQCPVTPYCSAMKELWEHVLQCKKQECDVRHCISSRYILSHYRKCRDESCSACGPVRTAIRKSKEKRAAAKAEALGSNQNIVNDVESGQEQGSGDETSFGEFRCESPQKKQKTAHASSDGEGSENATSSQTPSPCSAAVVSPYPNTDAANRPLQGHMKAACLDVLTGLQTHQHGWVFNRPVDPVELCLPDYFSVIKNPMDLGTVYTQLTNDYYQTPQDFESDVNLTFDNALTYNPEGSDVYNMAMELKEKFRNDFKNLVNERDSKEKERRQNLSELLSMDSL